MESMEEECEYLYMQVYMRESNFIHAYCLGIFNAVMCGLLYVPMQNILCQETQRYFPENTPKNEMITGIRTS